MKTKKVRLEKVLKQYNESYQKLLAAAGNPEFIQFSMMAMKTWDLNIEVKENWNAPSVTSTNEGIVVKPNLYLDFENLFGSRAYEKEFETFDEDTFCVIDFMEQETQGSVMISMLTETFVKFQNGKLKQLFEEYTNDYFTDTHGVIHLVVSVYDQDSIGEIRAYQFDKLEVEDSYFDTNRLDYAISRLVERVEISDLIRQNISRSMETAIFGGEK